MRLQTRASWLTLKFCFWLFWINFKSECEGPGLRLILSSFLFFPFLSSIVPRACGFSSELYWERTTWNLRQSTEAHTQTLSVPFLSQVSKRASSSRVDFIIQPGRQKLDGWITLELSWLMELQRALGVRESEPRSLTREWSIWFLNGLNICFPNQMVSSQALLLLWH